MDHATYRKPDEALAELRRKRTLYTEALRDWVAKGEASVHALPPEEAQRRLRGPSEEQALASANFRMGVYLHQKGHREDAQKYLAESIRLRPESWNFRRQGWWLEEPAKAGGPEFWALVDGLGDERYYPRIEMEGMPE
jgi:hypothetical protein